MLNPMSGSNENERLESADEIEQIRLLLFGDAQRSLVERIVALERRIEQLESIITAMVEVRDSDARRWNDTVKRALDSVQTSTPHEGTSMVSNALPQVKNSDVR